MRKIQRLLITVLLVCSSVLYAKAQGFMTDAYGRPVNEQAYTEVTGSPYLDDNWRPGDVAFKNGKVYKGITLRYDQVTDQLLFKNNKGDILAFTEPLHEFILPVTINGKDIEENYRNGFPPIDNNTTDSFYEVLSDGRTKILKRTKKIVQTHKEYSSANTYKDISSNVNYFILKNDQIQPLKADKKGVLSALSDKSADVEKYINDNKLTIKHDDDLKKVFDYYNSL